jgi:hypothetical protein
MDSSKAKRRGSGQQIAGPPRTALVIRISGLRKQVADFRRKFRRLVKKFAQLSRSRPSL